MSEEMGALSMTMRGVPVTKPESSTPATEAAPAEKAPASGDTPRVVQRKDEYIKGEKQPEASGRYTVSTDEDGVRKITFDNPEASKTENAAATDVSNSSEDTGEARKGGSHEKASEPAKNDGQVKSKITKLQKKKMELKRKLADAPDNSPQKMRLKQQLDKVEKELRISKL